MRHDPKTTCWAHIVPQAKRPPNQFDKAKELKLSPGQKAARTLKKRKAESRRRGRKAALTRNPSKKAHWTGKEAVKFARYKLRKMRYRSLSFQTSKGYEPAGVVDLVAARYTHRSPDRLEILLVQAKGGKRRKVTEVEKKRLRDVKRYLKVRLVGAEKPETKLPTISFF
jgi:hypothetical protein